MNGELWLVPKKQSLYVCYFSGFIFSIMISILHMTLDTRIPKTKDNVGFIFLVWNVRRLTTNENLPNLENKFFAHLISVFAKTSKSSSVWEQEM